MIKLTQHWFTHGQAWASVSKREQCLCRTSKNTRRPQKEPRRPEKEPRKPQQSVSKREQCIFVVSAYLRSKHIMVLTYHFRVNLFLGLLGITRRDIPRHSRRSTFWGLLGWDPTVWGLWTFRVWKNHRKGPSWDDFLGRTQLYHRKKPWWENDGWMVVIPDKL